ncbi:MAG: alpha/beta hydrolase [Planctomycetota bacterium]|jgi:pimeloyl-ACP methyl ester carboxylesterase|nr:alpha/beta hydrolase [Planctomycetota bacterium]
MAGREHVVLLHAAVVGKWSLARFGKRLEKLGFAIHNPGYPNRRLNLPDCALHLLPEWERIAASTPDRIHLVGHSMGGLIARRLVHLHQPRNLGRMVTLGTPHRGSPLADRLHDWKAFQWLFGPAGQDLVTGRELDWPAPWPPPCEIGLVAGSVPFGPGTLTLKRPNDGTVAEESSLPPGGTDRARVPATHTTIPYHPRTARLAAAFLRTGSFRDG